MIGGSVNKSDVVEKTLALAVRQLGGTDRSRKPRDVLSEGLLNALSALGVDDGALDDYRTTTCCWPCFTNGKPPTALF